MKSCHLDNTNSEENPNDADRDQTDCVDRNYSPGEITRSKRFIFGILERNRETLVETHPRAVHANSELINSLQQKYQKPGKEIFFVKERLNEGTNMLTRVTKEMDSSITALLIMTKEINNQRELGLDEQANIGKKRTK